jgi:hypothetical protein
MADREVEVIVRVADVDVLAGRLWCHAAAGLRLRRPAGLDDHPAPPVARAAAGA